MKIKVRNELQQEVFNLLKDTKGIDEARIIITNNLDNIDNNIYKTLQNNNYNMDYKVNFGFNYFPSKEYKGITYDWKKINEAISRLSDTKLFIDDTPGMTIGEIRAKCRRLASSEDGLGIVIIDYLQLLDISNPTFS